MSNFDHIGDLVAAREKIENLTARLDTAKADVDAWKLEFDVKVRSTVEGNDAFELVVTARVGQRGTTIVMNQSQVLSFDGDFETLSNMVASKAIYQLLENQVRQSLAPMFTQACNNLLKLNAGSSLRSQR